MTVSTAARQVLQLIQAPQRRGAEIFALQLCSALQERAWRSTMVSLFSGDERFVAEAGRAAVWTGTLGREPRAGPLSWTLVRSVAAHIDRGGYPVAQANGGATLKYLAAARGLGRGRWILVARTIGMPSYWRRDPFRRVAYRWWLRRADLVVAVCRRAAGELFREGVPPRRVTVIPNAVDARPFLQQSPDVRERVRAQAGVAPDELVIAHVGSLVAEKNQDALLRLTATLRASGRAVRLWVIGDGPARTRLQTLAEAGGMGGRVWWAGVRTDVADLLAAADLFVLTSLTEGMPAAVIEAGLSRLPVVAYDVGGLNEVVRDEETGVLVPPGDEARLHAAVERLATDAALRGAMGEAARRTCLSFDIGRVADQYAEVYARLLNGHAGT